MPWETVTVRSPYRDTSTRRNSSDPSALTIQTAGSLSAWKSAVAGSVNACVDASDGPDAFDAGACANATSAVIPSRTCGVGASSVSLTRYVRGWASAAGAHSRTQLGDSFPP